MSLTRRGFLGAMLAACAAPAIVRAGSLMKVSGIIIPAQDIITLTEAQATFVTGNSLLSIQMITKETLEFLENQLQFADEVNRHYDSQFAKIGDSLIVRRPARFVTHAS
jgi:P22 coat protein - gene protein 5